MKVLLKYSQYLLVNINAISKLIICNYKSMKVLLKYSQYLLVNINAISKLIICNYKSMKGLAILYTYYHASMKAFSTFYMFYYISMNVLSIFSMYYCTHMSSVCMHINSVTFIEAFNMMLYQDKSLGLLRLVSIYHYDRISKFSSC